MSTVVSSRLASPAPIPAENDCGAEAAPAKVGGSVSSSPACSGFLHLLNRWFAMTSSDRMEDRYLAFWH